MLKSHKISELMLSIPTRKNIYSLLDVRGYTHFIWKIVG